MGIRNLIICFIFCTFSFSCWGQKKEKLLTLPSGGIYDQPLYFNEDTINIVRKFPTSKLLFTKNVNLSSNYFKNASFRNSIFKDKTDFSLSTFYGGAGFDHSIFKDKTDFIKSTFLSRGADFEWSVFEKHVNFEGSDFYGSKFALATFKKSVSFNGVNFKEEFEFSPHVIVDGIAIFDDAKFSHSTYFSGSTFNGSVSFSQARFQKSVKFSDNFKEYVDFRRSYFNDYVDFSDVIFEKKADFGGAGFNNIANFNNIKGEIQFYHAYMPNILYFEGVGSSKVDFRTSIIDSSFSTRVAKRSKPLYLLENEIKKFKLSQTINKCVIQLKETNLSNIILPYDRFWVDTTGYNYEEKTALYEKLIKVCKEEGMEESVEGWSKELKRIQNIRTGEFTVFGHHFTFAGHFYNSFHLLFWNFGFSKSYIVDWITAVFILFYFLNLYIYPHLLQVCFNQKLDTNLFSTPQDSVESLTASLKKNRFIRFRYILHYTGVIFFALKLEHSDVSFKNLKWVAVIYFQFVIGIILLGFALNFVLSK